MKQLLFLLLFPCLALAQYTGNAGQKITLGEQTTADGLVWRGRLADTANLLTNKLDTSVYIVLDTGTRAMWYYRASTTPKWTRLVDSLNNLQGQLSLTTKVTGVLPLANGGTGSATLAGANILTGSGTTNYLPKFTSGRVLGNSRLMENDSNQIGFPTLGQFAFYTEPNYTFRYNGVTLPWFGFASAIENVGPQNAGLFFSGYQQIKYFTSNTFRIIIDNDGDLGVNTTDPTEKLHVVGNARITAMNGIGDIGANANGVLQAATSDMNLKNTIEDSPFGLNEILLLNPVTFLYNDENRKIDSDVKEVGFIAQDVFNIIPNAVSSTGTGDLQLDYRAITATLTKAIQEQQALIKALEQRILILENK